MKMSVYAIYDSAAEVFMRPMYMVNDAVAVRNFVSALRNKDSGMKDNAADYTLFKVAHWDDVYGVFEQLSSAQNLGNGLHLLSQTVEHYKKVARLHSELDNLGAAVAANVEGDDDA